MRALPDVNALIALLDARHLHHEAAWRWFRDNIRHGRATCSLIRNGCVRVMSQPAYPGSLPPRVVADRLRAAVAGDRHRAWADEVNLLDPGTIDWRHVFGPRQIADIHLLALAVAHEGRFVAFGTRICPRPSSARRTGISASSDRFCVR